MIVIGLIIGMFIIYPLLNYSTLSARQTGLSYQETALGMLNFGDFFRYLLPYFRRIWAR